MTEGRLLEHDTSTPEGEPQAKSEPVASNDESFGDTYGTRQETGATDRSADTASLRGLADDAPIELSLEVARFTLSLETLAYLAPGQVLLTGARIGERVALRAGRQRLAEGELVEVEGEVAVRILAVT